MITTTTKSTRMWGEYEIQTVTWESHNITNELHNYTEGGGQERSQAKKLWKAAF